MRQTGNVCGEVLVCARSGSDATRLVATRYPRVCLIEANRASSVAVLRAIGVQAARGELIAITEDHCIAPPDWYMAICAAHGRYSSPAIGGVVDNGATKRLVDWAVFMCEYSNFMSPAPQGVVHDLPGPNVSYKRNMLLTLDPIVNGEFWETVVHMKIEREGNQLWSDSSIRMLHKKHFTFAGFVAERYHYSRSYAGRRKAGMSQAQCLRAMVLTPLLPPVLLYRIGKRVLTRQIYNPIFIRALPFLVLFTVVWALGEAVGYVAGPGQSSLHLE